MTATVEVHEVKTIVGQCLEEIAYARGLTDRGLVNALVVRRRALAEDPDSWKRQMRLDVAEREAENRTKSMTDPENR